MPTDAQIAGRTSSGKSGRSSCLIAFLVLLAVVVVMGGGLIGLMLVLDGGGLSLGPVVGVIEVYGIITDSEKTVNQLIDYRKDKNVKAVIIRVDSPGGGVTATQEIYQEIERTKKVKPVIVSMGSIAASGGLYLAAPASEVLANRSTVTGSIGVIMQIVNIEDLMGKVGVSPIVIKSGKYKDMGSATRPMTDEDRAILQGVVDEMYHQFVADLAKGRKIEESRILEIADGRIFTGEKALKLGLVDRIGTFRDAIARAKALAGLVEEPRLLYPKKPQAWWKVLLGGQSGLNLLPQWAVRPVSFQYLYLPGQ